MFYVVFLWCLRVIHVMFYDVFFVMLMWYICDIPWCILWCSYSVHMMFYDIFYDVHVIYMWCFYVHIVLSGINIRDSQPKKVNGTSVLTTRGSGNNLRLAQPLSPVGNNLRLMRPLQRRHGSAWPPWRTSVSPEGRVKPSGVAESRVGPTVTPIYHDRTNMTMHSERKHGSHVMTRHDSGHSTTTVSMPLHQWG
jgi:hypothetical protein